MPQAGHVTLVLRYRHLRCPSITLSGEDIPQDFLQLPAGTPQMHAQG